MSEKRLLFLCGRFERMNFIYGVKLCEGDWYYFEDEDTIIDAHGSLPADLENGITQLSSGVHPIPITLDNNHLTNNHHFTIRHATEIYSRGSTSTKNKSRSTDDLVFMIGKTNPAIFLFEFEKCSDVKIDKDKLFKIRNFVNQEDKQEFVLCSLKEIGQPHE